MMNFFTCLAPKKKQDDKEKSPLETPRSLEQLISNKVSFTVHQLDEATQTFNQSNLLGEGDFGRVYKGTFGDQMVAVKQLDLKGSEVNLEFHLEVLFLSELNHPNLVDLIGYCSGDGNQKLLVYEYMGRGPLDRHLFNIPHRQEPLNWYRRMKIALDVAMGLQYLHRKERLPIIHQDLKCSNILLGEQYNAKLSDLGQGKFGVTADTYLSVTYISHGRYEANYLRARKLTAKSDIYNLGILMLELIMGCERSRDGKGLVIWVRTMFENKQRYKGLVDVRLKGIYPEKGLNKAVTIAMMCVQEDPESRPTIGDIIMALSHLATAPRSPTIPDRPGSIGPMQEVETVPVAKDQACSSISEPRLRIRDTP